MQFLTRFSLKNSAAVIIITILIALGGIIAATSLKVESMPDVSFGVVVINTNYPNASPEDVLEDVTKPIEKAITGMSGMKKLESFSSDNNSTVVAWLNSGVDNEEAREEIEKKLVNVMLPSDASRPKASTQGFASEPSMYLSISKKDESRSMDSFHVLVKDTINEDFEGIDGVEKVRTLGNQDQELRIYPKVDVLNNHGISTSQLKQWIQANHVAFPVGTVTLAGEDQSVRIVGEYTNIEQIKRTKLFLPSGSNGGVSYVQLGDIADIELLTETNSISRLNGKPGIHVDIYKTKESNEVEVGEKVKQKIEEYKVRYPDLQFETVYDKSVDTKNSINGMLKEGILGAVMASLMILVFLRHLKSTFIVLISIPLSIVVSLIFMSWLNISLNMMTLFGMAIAIGRVVDDSIVVIENIFRHLQLSEKREENIILYAAKEVIHAITSSTLTTVAVFAPITLVSGIIGEIFRPFAITVVCALMASLLVSVTIVPLFAKLMILHSNVKEHKHGKITFAYKRLLDWSLHHKIITTLVAISLLIGSLGLVSMLKISMMPEADMKVLFGNVTMPRGTELAVTDEMVKKIEAIVLKEQKVKFIESNIGSYSDSDSKITHRADLWITLESDADLEAISSSFRKDIEPLMPVGAEIAISKPSNGPNDKYQVVLNGNDDASLKQAAEMIKEKLKENPVLANVKDNLSDTKDQVVVRVDRDKAAEWNLSPVQVAGEISNLLSNGEIGKITIDGNEYDLTLGLHEDDANSLDKLRGLYIQTPTQQLVRLEDLATVTKEGAPSQIMRRDEKQFIQVTADINSSDKGRISQAATASLSELKLPEGVSLSTDGVEADMQKSFTEMFYALGAAVFMVYIVMVISFGNAMAPLAILLSLPLAAIGGLLGLFVTNSVLDVTTLIGFLMLIGIVVTNAIVYVDRVQQQREEGLSTREALLEAGVTRLRPIIMTAVATMVALLPLAMGLSEGTMMSKGLSIVVIGGLLTSTLLTLVVVPVGYEVLDKIRAHFLRRWGTDAQRNENEAKHSA